MWRAARLKKPWESPLSRSIFSLVAAATFRWWRRGMKTYWRAPQSPCYCKILLRYCYRCWLFAAWFHAAVQVLAAFLLLRYVHCVHANVGCEARQTWCGSVLVVSFYRCIPGGDGWEAPHSQAAKGSRSHSGDDFERFHAMAAGLPVLCNSSRCRR